MPFPPAELAVLRDARTVRIETGAPDGAVHRTVIWTVADGGDVFVRSYRGPGARWYREALGAGAATIVAGSRRLAVAVVPATDSDAVRRASTAILAKYAGDPAAKAMVRDEILGTTLRLEPT